MILRACAPMDGVRTGRSCSTVSRLLSKDLKSAQKKLMAVNLAREQIEAALPKVAPGLGKYVWLQGKVGEDATFHQDREFRRKYNGFYRVRRESAWQDVYYALMARAKSERLRFDVVLDRLHRATNRVEASFSSKLIATIDPFSPVIDSRVLKNLGLCLPYSTDPNRVGEILALYRQMASLYEAYLQTAEGRYLVEKFRAMYPNAGITEVKMLDFVLWQTET